MVNRENELPSNPLVAAVLGAIADWVSNYRNAIGFNSEFGMCGLLIVDRKQKDRLTAVSPKCNQVQPINPGTQTGQYKRQG